MKLPVIFPIIFSLKGTRNSFKRLPLNLWWFTNKAIILVWNIIQAATFKSFLYLSYKNKQLLFFVAVLFKNFMRQTLIDMIFEGSTKIWIARFLIGCKCRKILCKQQRGSVTKFTVAEAMQNKVSPCRLPWFPKERGLCHVKHFHTSSFNGTVNAKKDNSLKLFLGMQNKN